MTFPTTAGQPGQSGAAAVSRGAAVDHIASLDGLRALAIGCVFLAHGGLSEIVPGGLGVTLFFVLSGFLITTLMRVEHTAAGTLDLRAFYQRRVLRLMPPLLIVVVLTLLLEYFAIMSDGDGGGGRWPALGMTAIMGISAVLVLAVAVPMRLWVELPCAGLRRRLHRSGGWSALAIDGRTPAAHHGWKSLGETTG